MPTRVTSARLVGRASELAELEAALADADDGRASLVLVAGESGFGKSRLLDELVRRADAADARTLVGECVDLGEGELPYAALVGALRPLVRAGDTALASLPASARNELARLLPVLGAPGDHVPDTDGAAQGRLFEALLALLDRLGREAPVLLVIEDIHWADRSTRAFLAFLARSLARERVLAVASYRPDELHRRHPLRPLVAALESDARVRRLELAPLTHAELAEALADILGAPPAADLVDRLYARSEGNPLYMEELLAAGLDGRGALPASLRDALMVRTERLGDDAQEVLRVLAVAQRADQDAIAEASGLSGRELRDALREAVASHLLVVGDDGTYAFRHTLLREVVHDDLLPGERAQLHGILARALERRHGAQPGAHAAAGIAHHYLAAGDQPEALRTSIRAAAAADAVHAHGESAALLERALELWQRVPDPETLAGADHVSVLARAADAHAWSGERPRAEVLLRAALGELDEEREPHRAAALLRSLAGVQWALNRGEDALATVRRGLALVPADPACPERASLLSFWAKVRMLQGKFREAVEIARDAQSAASACGDERSLSSALNALGHSLFGLGDADEGEAVLRRALAIAREHGHPDEIDSAYVNLAGGLHLVGRTHDALDVLREGEAVLAGGGYSLDWLSLAIAELAFHAGDWDEAARRIPPPDRRFAGRRLLDVELRRVELALGRGDHETAAAGLARVRDAAAESSEPQFLSVHGALLAELRRRSGDLQGAREAVEETLDRLQFCTEDVGRLAGVAAVGVTVEADRAQRACDLGDAAEAADARTRLEMMLSLVQAAAEEEGRPVELAFLATATADAARGAERADPDAWADAAAAWAAVERPYPEALAGWREAEAQLQRGDTAAAAEALAAALESARALGARWLVGEAEALAARGRLRVEEAADAAEPVADAPEEPFGLTPRERQVLELVARGATNREIGATLFMAEKTASVHVSRILSKLDVRSRTEAAAVAHRLGLADGAGTGAVSPR